MNTNTNRPRREALHGLPTLASADEVARFDQLAGELVRPTCTRRELQREYALVRVARILADEARCAPADIEAIMVVANRSRR